MAMKFPCRSWRRQLLTLSFAIGLFTTTSAQNPILTENALTGNPSSEWDISGAGDLTIQGFGTDISVNKGQTISFKINVTDGAAYSIRIYRLGYYQGNGARLITNLGNFTGTIQPSPNTNSSTGLIDCGNWSTSASWAVPSTAVSGVYIARLTRTGNGGASHIVFVVRDDSGTSPVLFKTSDATWQAYNVYGGNSLYVGTTSYPAGHAAKVSYNRPYITRNGGGGGGAAEDWIFNAEYPMIRFLERNGYNMSYTTDVDLERNATAIRTGVHKIFLSVGHDEYWSANERTRVEAARNAGVHLAFFSGNEVYWKTRWEDNNRTLVCYKEGSLGENVCGDKCDPTTAWTGLWRSGCEYPSGGGCKPENALTGTISWAENTAAITVPSAYKSLRFWRNTNVASLANGQTTTFTNGTIGYEWDYEQYPDSYPNGRIILSNTDIDGKSHRLSLYRHASGALVFGAGSVQWSWGLDATHDRGSAAASPAMQQATVNLFADMGVQPGSLQSGLVAASASTDATTPQTVISSPSNGATITGGAAITISGTSSDAGGVVAGVEISVDGGTTWKVATGTTNWTYSWTAPVTAGTVNIRVRGFDDSGNMEVPGSVGSADNINVNVTAGSSGCPCTVFQPSATPAVPLENDGSAIELGFKFRSTQNGYITGIRFYKGAGNSGTHIGHLWSNTGTMLAEATFVNESASGWQQVLFASPVAVTANTTYIASYFSPSGAYSYTNPYFTTATVNGPLRGLANGEDGPNGVYTYTAAPAYPNSNYQTSNYWVDVVFNTSVGADVTPPAVSSVSPVNGATGVSLGAVISANMSEAISAASVTGTTFQLKNSGGNVIAATVNSSSNQITLTPSAALTQSATYTVTIKGGSSGVKDIAGNALASDYNWTFTTVASDVTPPTVSSVTPANGAIGIAASSSVTATLSEAINAATVTTSSFQLKNPGGTVITATVNASSNQISLSPSSTLSASTVYTVSIKGGSSGVKDLAGNALASDYTWSFTTAASGGGGSTSTVFQLTDVPAAPLNNDGTPIEVGFRFRSSQDGFITGIRFYKGSGNTGTHIGHLWTNTGTMLGEATFINESASGWQQVLFTSPVAITANTTYVASYFSSSGGYAITNPYFTQAVVNGPLRGLAKGEDGNNGVYLYTAASAFPTNNYQTSNYWVDVVFSTSTAPDNTAPTVSSVSPSNGSSGISTGTALTALFNEGISAASATATSFQLRDAGNNLIAATVSVVSNQVLLTPSASLSNSTTYTATLKGGASGIKDLAGNALVSDYTWSFTTASAPPVSTPDGPGGPILIVSSSSNPFSRYTMEMLKAEGLNEFLAKDISTITATELNNYDVVIIGEIAVTSAQATMFTNWVNAGGTLVAFRPSTQLSALLGITKVAGSLSDKYLLVNTSSGTPGSGIVNQTIQFHGTADLYTLNGATSLATLYSAAGTATSNPAVTTRNVGSNGGRAIAFTYDLPKSIVYTRQGNPAWAGQKRDGQSGPIRSDDMYFGGSEPDWVDLNKVAIPQADEQQRLLTNIILQGNLHRKPLPRFWFLPRALKAAIVMTGDDHSYNGTEGRFNYYLTLGPNTAQDVADWKAVRGTSYVYPSTPISNATAVAFSNQGFEIALHPTTGCQNFTYSSLQSTFTTQLSQFASVFPGLPAPVTNRNHCLVWSDWASNPKVEVEKGIRLNTSYYYWPGAWLQNRPGMFTGSGMPMRFADLDGTIIDNYQVVTQMTDESEITYGTFVNSLLDKAIGAEGYYGVFCANMHTDSAQHIGATTIINSALARQVPVISSKQLLEWLDGRNGSYFGAMTWNNNQLTFPVTALSGARNLKGMIPVNSENGQLISITRNGSSLSYTTEVIKGIDYAFFDVPVGTNTFVASYTGGSSTTAPSITTQPASQAVCAGANVTFTSAASGTPAPTVQWQVSTNNGSTWSNISGATASTYSFVSVAADNNKRFRAVWTNSAGTANSGSAILTVNTSPVLSSSLTGTATSGTAFTYTATSATSGTTFSWTRAAVTGISNAAGNGTGNVSETLTNTTTSPVTVTYVYTLSANGCTSTQNVVITVNPVSQPQGCTVTTSIATNFNSTAIAANRYIWFSSVFKPANMGTTGTVNFNVTNATITYTLNSQLVTLTVPNSHIQFSSSISISSTQFQNGVWEIRAPLNYGNVNVFMAGLAYRVPARIPGNASNVTWTATVASDKAGVSYTWKWAAAVYSSFTTTYSNLGVRTVDGTRNAGCPDSYRTNVVAGAKGSGGTNYTGNYSSTSTQTCSSGTRTMGALPVTIAEAPENLLTIAGLQLNVLPNPSETYFNLTINSDKDLPVTVILRDIFGRVLQKKERIAANGTIRFGDNWASGTYFAEVVQGQERRILKVIKTN